MFLPKLRIITKLPTMRYLSSTNNFIPCTSCVHYNADTRKCNINFEIKDEKNYVIHGRGDMLAVEARNNELCCGKTASKFKYCDKNLASTNIEIMIVTFAWSLPIMTTNLLFDSYFMLVPYIIHLAIIYRDYKPTYNPHTLPCTNVIKI